MDEDTTQRREREETEVPLPPNRAFVVQFRAQADPKGELFVGRAEHLASGAAERFGSPAELIAFIAKVLAPEASAGIVSASPPTSGVPVDAASSGEIKAR